METEEILSQVDEEFKKAAKNPISYDFSQKPPYKVGFTPEHPEMSAASVDLENLNIKISYDDQSPLERYNCVKHDPEAGVGLVEAKKSHDHRGTKVNSQMHYLVAEDQAFRNTMDGYEETLLERPVEVANSFEELYRRALREDNERKGLEWGSRELGHVPTPAEEAFMD
jgi:hypothetical protein